MYSKCVKRFPYLLFAFWLPAAVAQQTVAATFGDVIRLQGGTPSDIVLDQLRHQLYLVANTTNQVVVLDYTTDTVVGQIAAGKIRPLATAAKKRAAALPDVPTMAEAGMPDFDTSLWFGLLAPVGTPRPVIEKLAFAARQAMHTARAMASLSKQGYEPLDAGPDEFAAYMRSEIARWSDVARNAGLLKS